MHCREVSEYLNRFILGWVSYDTKSLMRKEQPPRLAARSTPPQKGGELELKKIWLK